MTARIILDGISAEAKGNDRIIKNTLWTIGAYDISSVSNSGGCFLYRIVYIVSTTKKIRRNVEIYIDKKEL